MCAKIPGLCGAGHNYKALRMPGVHCEPHLSVLEPSCKSRLRRLKHSQGTDLAKASYLTLYLDNSRLILAEDRKAVADSGDERTVRIGVQCLQRAQSSACPHSNLECPIL